MITEKDVGGMFWTMYENKTLECKLTCVLVNYALGEKPKYTYKLQLPKGIQPVSRGLIYRTKEELLKSL